MMLSKRLQAAYDLYDPCGLAADIGTDHALLPAALLDSGRCGRMILSDISPSALANARAEIARRGLESRADLRLGDGLNVIHERCACISILGMGGPTAAEILTEGRGRLQGASLILSAHTSLPVLRLAVMDIGYHFVREFPCFDAGRFYIMMKAVPGEEELSELEIRNGKRIFESPSEFLLPWLEKNIRVLQTKIQGLNTASNPDIPLLRETQQDLDYCRSRLEKIRTELRVSR